MPKTSTSWAPGQSGNPNGRPPKNRALSAILERAGAKGVEYEGKRVSGKRLVALLLWQIATKGIAVLPDGKEIVAGPQGWLDVVKFIYAQVDGPPPKDVNLGGQADNPLIIDVVWDEAGLNDSSTESSPSTDGGEGE